MVEAHRHMNMEYVHIILEKSPLVIQAISPKQSFLLLKSKFTGNPNKGNTTFTAKSPEASSGCYLIHLEQH